MYACTVHMYQCIYELWLYDSSNIALHYIATKFISKYSIKRALDTEMMNSYQFFKCRLKATHKKFHFDLSFNLSQGKVHDVSVEVQNNLWGGAHLPTPPVKIRPCCIPTF